MDTERINSLAIFLSSESDRTTSRYIAAQWELVDLLFRLYKNNYYSSYGQDIGEEKFNNFIGDYSEAFIETVKACVKYYDQAKGEFIAYFGVSYKSQRDRYIEKEENREKLHGMTVGEKCAREVKRLIKIVREKGVDPCSKQGIDVIFDLMKYHSRYKREEIANMVYTLCKGVAFTEFVDNEGEEHSLFDMLGQYDRYNDENDEKIKCILEFLEKIYLSEKGKTQKIIGAMLTLKIIDSGILNEELNSLLRKYKFCDDGLIKKYFASPSGFKYKSKEIAGHFSVSEAYVSKLHNKLDSKLAKERENLNNF